MQFDIFDESLEQKLAQFDLSKFDIKKLEKLLGVDVFVKYPVDLDKAVKKGRLFTISDFLTLEVSKGDENLYADIDIYFHEGDIETAHRLSIYTKEDHSTLKKFIREVIRQA